MKCQRCPKAATLHITEVTGETSFDELHLCEECAQKYLYEPQAKGGKIEGALGELDDTAALNQRECPQCGVKFAEFRASGRLGCPHDYDAFREELVPLLTRLLRPERLKLGCQLRAVEAVLGVIGSGRITPPIGSDGSLACPASAASRWSSARAVGR